MKQSQDIGGWEKFFIAVLFLIAITAFCIALSLLIYPPSWEIQKQAIYWFIIPVICLLVLIVTPYIKELSLNVGDFKISLKQLDEFNRNMRKISASLAIKNIFDYLEGDLELTDTEIGESINSHTSQIALDAIYSITAALRERIVMQIIHGHSERDENSYRSELDRFIPVLEALIKANPSYQDVHLYEAQLAYIYKDRFNPKGKTDDLIKAHHHIQNAIKSRNKFFDPNLPYRIYEFNRLVICIRESSLCKDNRQLLEDFDIVWGHTASRYMLFDTSQKITDGSTDDSPSILSQWIDVHRKQQKQEWEEIKSKMSDYREVHR